jgi:hypothetical protein
MARSREELDAIINGYNSNPFTKLNSYNVSDAGRKALNDFNAAGAERGMLDTQQAGNAGASRAEQNWQDALANTKGRGDAMMNDPRITAALDMIQKQMGEGPYTDKIVNQMANRSADRNAAIAGNTADSLRAQMANTGGNAMDPSYQAALRAADTNRAVQTSTDRGDLESKSTLANYSAQNQAANQLASQRMQQHNSANTQYNQASQLYANQSQSGAHVNAYGQNGGQNLNYTPPNWGQMQVPQQGGYAGNGANAQSKPTPAKTPEFDPMTMAEMNGTAFDYNGDMKSSRDQMNAPGANAAQQHMYNQNQVNRLNGDPGYDLNTDQQAMYDKIKYYKQNPNAYDPFGN